MTFEGWGSSPDSDLLLDYNMDGKIWKNIDLVTILLLLEGTFAVLGSDTDSLCLWPPWHLIFLRLLDVLPRGDLKNCAIPMRYSRQLVGPAELKSLIVVVDIYNLPLRLRREFPQAIMAAQ